MLFNERNSMTVISPSSSIDGEGWLMVNQILASRSDAIQAIGCTDADFNHFLLACAHAEERNGKIWFPDHSLGQICLFCLVKKYQSLKAA